jgi:translation initiation factor 5B
MERLRSATDKLLAATPLEYKLPGLLVIDTPGHESFVNLRSRGTGLCDIAVLVVDIMHGLERQTIESIQLLKQKKTPFVVALNKIDRMYGWKPLPNAPVRESLAQQPEYARGEFDTRLKDALTQLSEQGLNARLYYENEDVRRNVSVVPTSAATGEGVPDLLMLVVQLTQQLMGHRLQFSDDVQATILEVKAIDGFGTTVDVVLVNGELREGDTLVACGMDGPIVTQARALLTPPPLREMRVKSEYVHHKRIEAAMGVKIAAHGLDRAIAGTALLVAHADDEIEDLRREVMADFEGVMKGFKRDAVGVLVQASTLGSLEALLEYLRTHDPPVPVANVGIGPLHRKDIVAASVMLERVREYATVLAFDVKVTPEARAAADELGVTVFTADIIYHLTDKFEAFLKAALASKQAATAAEAVFPAICRIIPTAVFNKRDPIVVGLDVVEGKLRVGTPLCVILAPDSPAALAEAAAAAAAGTVRTGGPSILTIGRVASIEHNHIVVPHAVAGGPSVAVKIAPDEGHQALMYGRHFDHTQLLYSRVSRGSIDLLKENFRVRGAAGGGAVRGERAPPRHVPHSSSRPPPPQNEMSTEYWQLVVKLKGIMGVI